MRKIWKLSPMDLESYSRWYDYSRARDPMFAASDRPDAPWYIIASNDKRRARLNCIAHILRGYPAPSDTAKEGHPAQAPDCRRLRGAGLPVPPGPPALLTAERRRRRGRIAYPPARGRIGEDEGRAPAILPRPPILAGEEERQPLGPANRAEDALLHAIASADRGCRG